MKLALAALMLMASTIVTIAHDTYATGLTVPAWVKQHCCGVADIHRYSLNEVYYDSAGWHLPGLNQAVPDTTVEASEDEYVYAFFTTRAMEEGEATMVWCLFIPQGSV